MVRRPDRESPQLGRFVVVGRDEEMGTSANSGPQFEPFADLEAVDAVHLRIQQDRPALPGRRPWSAASPPGRKISPDRPASRQPAAPASDRRPPRAISGLQPFGPNLDTAIKAMTVWDAPLRPLWRDALNGDAEITKTGCRCPFLTTPPDLPPIAPQSPGDHQPQSGTQGCSSTPTRQLKGSNKCASCASRTLATRPDHDAGFGACAKTAPD